MLTTPMQLAIQILHRLIEDAANDLSMPFHQRQKAIFCLHHAIKHLARPDRALYPKVRGASKGDPIVRRSL